MTMTDTTPARTIPAMPITPLGDEVLVWTKPGCPQCVATERDLARKGVPFRMVDITEHPAAADVLRDAGQLQMPAVQFRDEMWAGFQPDRITSAAQRLVA